MYLNVSGNNSDKLIFIIIPAVKLKIHPKTKLFIIIGSIILGVAILAVVLVLVLGNNKNEDKNYDNENHYEEDNINNSTNDTVNENEYINEETGLKIQISKDMDYQQIYIISI